MATNPTAIGACIGEAFVVLMALGEGGMGPALAAFAIVVLADLVLENLLEPKLLGFSLELHAVTRRDHPNERRTSSSSVRGSRPRARMSATAR